MKNPCSVYLQVTEVAPCVLSVRLASSLNLDPVDSRTFMSEFLSRIVPGDKYRVFFLYDGSALVVARDGVAFTVCRDLACSIDVSFTLVLEFGEVVFSFTPVAGRDVIASPASTTIGYRGTFDFEPNVSEEVSQA